MVAYKCKLCGGDIEFEPGATVGMCNGCGARVKLEPSADESVGVTAEPKKQKSKKLLAFVAAVVLVGAIAGGVLLMCPKEEPVEDTVSLEIGDYLNLGHYDTLQRWIVLDKDEDKVLLLSLYPICNRAYNDERNDVTWSTCSLREWLNTDFLTQAFSPEDRERIVDTPVHTEDNPWYGTPGGDDTVDKVFLLSIEEAEKYLSEDEYRITRPNGYGFSVRWWLRSPGINFGHAAVVNTDGTFYNYGNSVDDDDYAVRPALWIKVDP